MELTGQFSRFYGAFATIYALTDPEGSIFYVGCTVSDPKKRLLAHLKEAERRYHAFLNDKIRKIRSIKYQVGVDVLDITWVTAINSYEAAKKARKLENQWIKKLIDQGANLTNSHVLTAEDKTIKFNRNYELWVSKNKNAAEQRTQTA